MLSLCHLVPLLRRVTVTMVLLFIFLRATVNAQPSQGLFAIPLRNCTFDSGAISWGCLVEVGSPGQRLCLVPSTVSNSTLLSKQSLCNISNATSTTRQCESIRGGFFDESQSRTWQNSSLDSFNDTRANPTWDHFNPEGKITRVGYDTLHFPDAVAQTIYGYGFALNERGNQSNAGMLGLGVDSLFLESVDGSGNRTPKSWSLDSGSQSVQNPREGQVVIGGQNQGRIDGSFLWSNISNLSGDRACPLRTKVTSMTITLKDGSVKPLMASSETTEACIEPYDNLFRLTPSMILHWKTITNFNESVTNITTTANIQNLSFTELGLLYEADKISDWILSITLDNGFTTTLPHYELQAPLRGWNSFGEKETVPGIVNVAIFNNATGGDEIPTLGKIFLSQSYLSVEYCNNRFGLANSKLPPIADNLVPTNCTTCLGQCNGTSNTNPPNPTPPNTNSPNLRLILGLSLGGSAALITLAFSIWWVRKRYKPGHDDEVHTPSDSSDHR